MQLIDKIEAVITRMRWKAIFFDDDNDKDNANENQENQPETYGLKTPNTPQPVPEMSKTVKRRHTKNQQHREVVHTSRQNIKHV